MKPTYTHIPCDCQYWETCRYCCIDPVVAVLKDGRHSYVKRSDLEGGDTNGMADSLK